MKRCTYCGKEYPNHASVCPVDGQPLEELVPMPQTGNQPKDGTVAANADRMFGGVERPKFSESISRESRFLFLVTAWGVAAVAMAIPMPGVLLYFWVFPAGLLPRTASLQWSAGIVFNASIIVGWSFYVALTVVAFLQSRRARYFVYYAILCALLATNVVSCHVILHDLRHIR
jgi:hypothetical protein